MLADKDDERTIAYNEDYEKIVRVLHCISFRSVMLVVV